MKPDKATQYILVILGLGLPLFYLVLFYQEYAQAAWFFQEDFPFISHYALSLHGIEILTFANLGRFISRNLYWHFGLKFFSLEARSFFYLNLSLIFLNSLLILKTFKDRYRLSVGVTSAILYLALPGTIHCYAWISNSQHLLGQMFVFLFVALYSKCFERDQGLSFVRFLLLIISFTAGMLSNIFVMMALSLPAWKTLTSKAARSQRNYLLIAFGATLSFYFFQRLSAHSAGAYEAFYNFSTVFKNASFYFGGAWQSLLWGAMTLSGFIFGYKRKNVFLSWLFAASFFFFLPFAFLVHQRHVQYATLTHLFFLIGIIALVEEVWGERFPLVAQASITVLVLLVFSTTNHKTIRFFRANPWGKSQKKLVGQLALYDQHHPRVTHYCFRTRQQAQNQTGVKEWDIPSDWWFLGFGEAFKTFINPQKSYELSNNTQQCDVTFLFDYEALIEEG